MPKILRNDDVLAQKFQIDVHLIKVEFRLTFPCRLSVIFQRGNHKKESNSSELKDNHFALFNEMFTIISTFFYDNEKKLYIDKEALFAVQIITNRGIKIAGSTKINLSEYMNSNHVENFEYIENDTIIPIGKCIDKNAKFHIRLSFKRIEDIDTRYAPNFETDQDIKIDHENSDLVPEVYETKGIQTKYPLHNIMQISASSIMVSKNHNDDEKLTSRSFLENFPRESEDFAFWKYHTQKHNIATLKVEESAIKTRDTLGHQFSFITLPELNFNEVKQKKFDNSSPQSPNAMTKISKNKNELELSPFNKRIIQLEEQLALENREKNEFRIKLENQMKDSQKMKDDFNKLQKEYETCKELYEGLKLAKTLQRKRINFELKLFKEKISNVLTRNNNDFQIENDPASLKYIIKDLQKLCNDLISKLESNEGIDHTKSNSPIKSYKNQYLDGIGSVDLFQKIHMHENTNNSLNQTIDRLKMENSYLKKQITEIAPNLRLKDINQHEIEDQGDKNHRFLNEIETPKQTPEINEFMYFSDQNMNRPAEKKRNKWLEKKNTIGASPCKNGNIHKENYLKNNVQPQYLKPISGQSQEDNYDIIHLQPVKIEELIAKNDELIKENEELSKKLNRAQIDLAEIEIEVNNLNQLVSEKANTISELQRLINLQNKMIDDYKNSKKILMNEDNVQNEKLLSELRKLDKDKKALELELNSMRQLIDSIKEQNMKDLKDKQDELNSANQTLEALRQENKKYKEEKSSIKVKADSQIMLMQIDNDKLKRYIEELELINQKCKCNNIEMVDIKHEKQVLAESIIKYQEEIKKLQNALAEMENERDSLKIKYEANEQKINDMLEAMKILEGDAWKTKLTLAKMMNAAFEYGGANFIEIIEQYLS